MIELKPITKSNFEDVINLSVREEQEAFVSSNAFSLAQAYVYKDTAFPFAVYADGAAVGFIMLGYFEERDQYTLWKFMIDKRFQGMGFGKEALRLGINYLKDVHGAKEVYTGVVPENETAKRLYRSVGFRETGLFENNMIEMKYIC